MSDHHEPTPRPRAFHLAGLALASLTAAAAWWVWTATPGLVGRLGYGDLGVLSRVIAIAAVFAVAARLDHLLDRLSSRR
jgi:hypothetical protein